MQLDLFSDFAAPEQPDAAASERKGGDVVEARPEDGRGGAAKVRDAADGETRRGSIPDTPVILPPEHLEEVLSHLTAMPKTLKRDHKRSAVKAIGRVLGRRLDEIPTEPKRLAQLLESAVPAAAGMTATRWSRVRSLLLAALVDTGVQVMRGRDTRKLSPAWSELADAIPDKRRRIGVSRLVSFCSGEGIEPHDVDAKAFEKFGEALAARSLSGGPDAVYRSNVRQWNRCVGDVPGWPAVMVELPPDPRLYSLPWEGFRREFVDDVEAFLAHSGNQDPLADDYVASVKPGTVVARRRQVRQLASALVLSGFPIDRLTGLDVLVAPANAKAALNILLDRRERKPGIGVGQQAQLLRTIARYWVRTDDHDRVLKQYASSLSLPRKGMVQRNRTRLRQFDLRENRDALLWLPQRVFKAVEAEPASLKNALRVMLALAVELLLVAPMRVNNLAGLSAERHLVLFRRGRVREWHIVIPPDETKTGVPFEIALPADAGRLLDVYLDQHRSNLHQGAGPYLFPGRNGGRRATIPFSQAISAFIRRETGLEMNAHLFRHLAAKLYLDVYPADSETVRRLLGHTTTATTNRAYAEVRTDHAFRRYDALIERYRREGDAQAASGREIGRVRK